MGIEIGFRWLGVAGIELITNGQVLINDPFLSRFPTRKIWFGRLRPDQALIAEKIQRCDYVLVTHAHWDHIMDVPDVIRNTGAMAFGSSNSCRLLAVCGVPQEKIQAIRAGERLALEAFQIEVLQVEHRTIPGFLPGPLPCALKPPLRARDYRMDGCFSFLIIVHGRRVLTDPGVCPEDAVAADVLFVFPGMEYKYYVSLLDIVQPKIVIPYHWDDLFRPLSKPLRPYWKLPRWTLAPLQRLNLVEFKAMIERIAPGTSVFEPEILCGYDLEELLSA